jgi:hypothetical protein
VPEVLGAMGVWWYFTFLLKHVQTINWDFSPISQWPEVQEIQDWYRFGLTVAGASQLGSSPRYGACLMGQQKGPRKHGS